MIVVSKSLNSPYQDHWDAIIGILNYIKNVLDKGLICESKINIQTIGYFDTKDGHQVIGDLPQVI